MPRIKQELIFTVFRGLSVFLRLDAGIGREVPTVDGAPPKKDEKPARKSRKKPKALRVESLPERLPQTHAIPEPDPSIKRNQVFRSLVSPLKPGKMLDLGAGPGAFSILGADMGWKVTAVDARTVRTPEAASEKDARRSELINSINWVEEDVRDFPIEPGDYDLICFFGLMHHLGAEDQLKMLEKCSHTLTILSVRVSPEVVVSEGPYQGSYYQEKGETRAERDAVPTAAWGNEVSFHPTEESLLRMARDSGFSKVMAMRPPHSRNYNFYLCLP